MLAIRLASLAFAIGLAAGAVLAKTGTDLDRLKSLYERPEVVPFPPDNPYGPEKAALGRRLFFDPALSAGGTLACASCHVRALGYESGVALSTGAQGEPLARHTPTLWNLAWGEFFFWDGRADSLEAQAAQPIASHVEMNMAMGDLIPKLAADPAYAEAFAAAFPDDPHVTRDNLLRAIATFERTLVSPPTRFDRWIEGDETALTGAEKRGFLLFNGKANCAACHSGWAFTDHAFHDIGLAGDDLGRGPVIGLDAVNHAFKTPTLRDVGRRAPYMHDGSLPTLETVIAHYEHGIVERPTLSADLEHIQLTKAERRDLLAFLGTLDHEGEAAPLAGLPPATDAPSPDGTAVATHEVSQRDKDFTPDAVRLETGDRLLIHNEDVRVHNVRVFDPKLDYNSGLQAPGETIEIVFPEPGRYFVYCAIHPKMQLTVDAAP